MKFKTGDRVYLKKTIQGWESIATDFAYNISYVGDTALTYKYHLSLGSGTCALISVSEDEIYSEGEYLLKKKLELL